MQQAQLFCDCSIIVVVAVLYLNTSIVIDTSDTNHTKHTENTHSTKRRMIILPAVLPRIGDRMFRSISLVDSGAKRGVGLALAGLGKHQIRLPSCRQLPFNRFLAFSLPLPLLNLVLFSTLF